MKKFDIEKIFNKLSLQVRSTGHNYGYSEAQGVVVKNANFKDLTPSRRQNGQTIYRDRS